MKKHMFLLVLSMLTFALAINGQKRYSYVDDDVYCGSRVEEIYEENPHPAMRVLPGGKITQEDVIQYDTKYLNVHHRQRVIRRDIYDNREIEYIQQNEYYVPRTQEYESNCYIDRMDRKYTCYERLGLNYIEGTTWTVNFNMDSYAIPYSGYTNGVNIREFARTRPNAFFDLYGSSDIGTGTTEYNHWLASKRVNAVRALLVRNYNISPDRIRIHVLESGTQLYAINNWNRCVLIKASIRR